MSEPVLFEEKTAENGTRYGIVSLNSPKTLNSLSLDICQRLTGRLQAWADDPGLAFVILTGEGDRAFCAGGDLQGLYKSIQETNSRDPAANAYAAQFFETEYRLDFLIHHYPKPLLCWGDGYVMGGGVGLMMGASHRVVNETSRLAMPEISIGLFPDVGASWMLNRMSGSLGLFLALTGAQLEASDAIFTGLADFSIDRKDWPDLLLSLHGQPWAGESSGRAREEDDSPSAPRAINDGLMRQAIARFDNRASATPGPLRRNAFQISSLCNSNNLEEIVDDLMGLSGNEDAWLARAATNLKRGAPGTARLAFALQRHTRLMSLADVFRQEYIVALNCTAFGDLEEGIRALLIDKDHHPRWEPPLISEATAAWSKPFLEAPWLENRRHPLADLGATPEAS
jgi:enoyl-CoA hydratase/carnithine racemase